MSIVAAIPMTQNPAESDSTTLNLARKGDTSGFDTLFHRHYLAIHAFAYRLTLCPAEADDITQETFVHAARSLSGYQGRSSVKNWLFAIAANRSRDRHRQRARRLRLSEQLARLSSEPFVDERDLAAAEAAHDAVRDALLRLTPEQREAVALVYYENLSHADAARVLGCAETTVSWRVFRAKNRLKQLLRDAAPSSHRHD